MVIKEFYRTREDGVNLYRTYSDTGHILIRNDGVEYDEAVDVETSPYTYTESEKMLGTEEDIPTEEMEGVMTDEGKGNSGSDCTDKT